MRSFEEKSMRYPVFYFLLAAVLAVLSCEESWVGMRTAGNVAAAEPPDPESPETQGIPVFNFVIAEYPDWYDWIRDPQYGTVDCRIVMYDQKGRQLCSFPAGYYHEAATDADMVRSAGGHVFTDYSTDSRTVIRKDGKEIFSYAGREMIAGFIEDSGIVYTLGIPREGEGLVFRMNGEAVTVSASGEIMHGLYMDEGKPVFAYKVTEIGDYRMKSDCFIVEDGITTEIRPASSSDEITDIVRWNGTMYVLSWNMSAGKAYWTAGADRREMHLDGERLYSIGGIVTGNSAIYASGWLDTGPGGVRAAFWKNGKIHDILDSSFNVVACCPDGDDLNIIGYYSSDTDSFFLVRNGSYTRFPEGYRLDSASCAVFCGGHYCICLNPVQAGMPPLLILDGEECRLDVNGCFLSAGYSLAASQDSVLD